MRLEVKDGSHFPVQAGPGPSYREPPSFPCRFMGHGEGLQPGDPWALCQHPAYSLMVGPHGQGK